MKEFLVFCGFFESFFYFIGAIIDKAEILYK